MAPGGMRDGAYDGAVPALPRPMTSPEGQPAGPAPRRVAVLGANGRMGAEAVKAENAFWAGKVRELDLKPE